MDNRRLVVPSPDQGGNAPAPGFPGFSIPSQDFQAVRDDRRSKPLMYTIDLSSARSISAGTALALPLQGNVFYSDPLYDLNGNSVAGVARVHFQDQSLNPVGTYFTVQPQFICRVPFTQLLVENYAQPGKFLQIVYGIDLDIVPGLSNLTQTTISGNVNTQALPNVYGASYVSNTSLAANTAVQVVAPASNVSGVRVWDAYANCAFAAGLGNLALLAKASAPANPTDGDAVAIGNIVMSGTILYTTGLSLTQPKLIAAGKGLYWINSNLENSGYRAVNYTIL